MNISPIRYRGYYYDDEIGMYYLQSRYYDQIVGRFVNAYDQKLIGLLSQQSIIGPEIHGELGVIIPIIRTILKEVIFSFCKNTILETVIKTFNYKAFINYSIETYDSFSLVFPKKANTNMIFNQF